jgi:hypothetical protein
VFVIGKRQLEAIGEEDFTRRVAELFGDDLVANDVAPPEALPMKQLEAMARHAIEVAQRLGFETERDIVAIALDMVKINPEFYLQPDIRRILTDASIPPGERHERILTDVEDDAWEEAAKMTDPRAYWAKVLGGNQP